MTYFNTQFNITSSSASFICIVTIKLYDKYSFQSAVILLIDILKKKGNSKSCILLKGLLLHIISGASISPISHIYTNAMLLLLIAVH